jgi:hypothetical protein
MNSYETRLNDLKLLTNQLDNKDLVNEIENFSLKWSETYSLISRFKFSFYKNIIFFLNIFVCVCVYFDFQN